VLRSWSHGSGLPSAPPRGRGRVTSRLRLAGAVGVVVAGVAIGVPATAATSNAAASSAVASSAVARTAVASSAAAAGTANSTAATRRTADRAAVAGHARARDAAAYPVALSGFACRTLTHCVAVGANAPQMATKLVAERWNGSSWSTIAMPKPADTGDVAPGDVACPADHECVAVGVGYQRTGSGYFAIAEHWNGSRWTAARAADPGSSSLVGAVSCPSARSCYAVGQYTPRGSLAWAPLIEHWDGGQWFQQTAPVPPGTSYGSLSGVSCPTAKFCVAVGTDGAGALIERWNGRRWSASVPSSPSAMLYGVSCPSAASCFAVGTGSAAGGSLVERWRGGRWTGSVTPVPSGSSYPWLQSVSCASATRCLAVGDDLDPGVYADSWNGRGWHLVSMVAVGGHLGELTEVRCLAAASCVALADTTQTSATQRSESAFWNGTRWKVIPTA